jgi:hypothetical protein
MNSEQETSNKILCSLFFFSVMCALLVVVNTCLKKTCMSWLHSWSKYTCCGRPCTYRLECVFVARYTRVTVWGCYRMSQKTPCIWSRRVPHCRGSGKVTYGQVFCHFPLFCLHWRTLPSGQKPSLITMTVPLNCNFFPSVVQGLFAHPVLS